jgi:hypothetical protein
MIDSEARIEVLDLDKSNLDRSRYLLIELERHRHVTSRACPVGEREFALGAWEG